jgi:ribonuclease VapC
VIVVDTSVLIAILKDEPDAERFRRALEDDHRIISIVSIVEAHLAGTRYGIGRERVDELVDVLGLEIVDVSAGQLPYLLDGMARFAKGRGAYPAVLNFGDLFAYALARERNLPLLYKGDDFALTDVLSAVG